MASPPAGLVTSEEELAVVELLGAMTYGQLRAFVAASTAVALAPQIATAEALAEHARREHDRFRSLRTRLDALTDLPEAVIERQRPAFDAFFEDQPTTWLRATTNLAVGLPMAADFARAVAPAVDDETAAVLVEALADREEFESFALAQLQVLLDDDGARGTARTEVAGLVGRALTGYRGVIARTDALRVLFEAQAAREGTTAERVVKQLALTVLTGHRERTVMLGLDDLE